MNRILILGEAPGARNAGGLTRTRITNLSGSPWETWADWRNLLDDYPGSGSSGGASWNPRAARQAAVSLDLSGYDLVILLGRRVAGAVLPAGAGIPFFRTFTHHSQQYAVIPHTSGIVRFWNDPDNADRARVFLTEIAAIREEVPA